MHNFCQSGNARPANFYETHDQIREVSRARLHFKLVRKSFHKYGKATPWALRVYLLAWMHFPKRNAFHVNELLDVLGKYGYGTSREARADLVKKLRAMPEWFTERTGLYFSFKSKHKIVGMSRDKFVKFNAAVLKKENSRAWTDLLIALQASGQQTAAQNLCNQTGYGRARIFDALKSYKAHRVRILIPDTRRFTKRNEALSAAAEYWRKDLIADVIQTGDFFQIFFITGLSFNDLRDSTSDGAGRITAPGLLSRVEPAKGIKETSIFKTIERRTGINAVTGEPITYTLAISKVKDFPGYLFAKYGKQVKRVAA